MKTRSKTQWASILGAAILAAFMPCSSALAQDAAPSALQGTLKTIKATGKVRVGYRESSIPFSYLNPLKLPIGYSIDICREIVDDISDALDHMPLDIAFVPVTAATRFEALKAGTIDLECGSTTNNFLRQKDVAFSPVFFIAGTKLLVAKDSQVKSYKDLAGQTVVVTAGTTNAQALQTLSDKQKLGLSLVSAPDHAQSLAELQAGKAAAFATDDVLLYGFVATEKNGSDFHVVGDYLSYDPYGIGLRRDDPDMAGVVERSFTRLATSRRLTDLYEKWFMKRLPSGEILNLPMSPQLEEALRVLGQPD